MSSFLEKCFEKWSNIARYDMQTAKIAKGSVLYLDQVLLIGCIAAPDLCAEYDRKHQKFCILINRKTVIREKSANADKKYKILAFA